MDTFVEQLVERFPSAGIKARRALTALAAGFLSLFILFVSLFVFPMLIVLAVGVVYLAWVIIRETQVEYEYILTGTELDIDKVMGRRRRKRMITLQLSRAKEWGQGEPQSSAGTKATVVAHSGREGELWYLIADNEKIGGSVLLYFSPNEHMAFAMNGVMPYQLRRRDLPEPAPRYAPEAQEAVNQASEKQEKQT